jgi:hypothetical protein
MRELVEVLLLLIFGRLVGLNSLLVKKHIEWQPARIFEY